MLVLPIFVVGESKKIMVFHSYHQGLEWTDEVTKGIFSAFNPMGDSVEIFIDYLDSKRIIDPDYYIEYKNLFK